MTTVQMQQSTISTSLFTQGDFQAVRILRVEK